MRVAERLLLRRRGDDGRRAARARRRPRRDRRPRDQLDPDRRRHRLRVGRTAPTSRSSAAASTCDGRARDGASSDAAAGQRSPTTSRRTSSPPARRGAARAAPSTATGRSAATPRPAGDHRQGRPLRSVRHRGPRRREAAPPKRSKKAAAKPRTASLFKDMDLDDDRPRRRRSSCSRCRASSAPTRRASRSPRRTAATAPTSSGAPTRARCTTEQQLFDITLDEALAIYAQPKHARPGARQPRSRSSAPTRSSGKPIVVKDGRFGPYVTDGETNATLRKDDDPESITPERGFELLAEKRAKGPRPASGQRRRRPRRRPRSGRPRRQPRRRPDLPAHASSAAYDICRMPLSGLPRSP